VPVRVVRIILGVSCLALRDKVHLLNSQERKERALEVYIRGARVPKNLLRAVSRRITPGGPDTKNGGGVTSDRL